MLTQPTREKIQNKIKEAIIISNTIVLEEKPEIAVFSLSKKKLRTLNQVQIEENIPLEVKTEH